MLKCERLEDRRLLAIIGNNLPVGDELRNYRLAIAATAEYTAFHGGPVGAMTAIQTFVSDLNALYEREFAIHFDLVANNANIIFTNPATDPYTDQNNLGLMLTQNQQTLDNVSFIGAANYDIGHVFGTRFSGGSGLASIGAVGQPTFKGRGASTSSSPRIGWPWWPTRSGTNSALTTRSILALLIGRPRMPTSRPAAAP